MSRVKLVTGFVSLANHPRTAGEYAALGQRLQAVNVPQRVYHWPLEACWLDSYLREAPPCSHSEGDNPAKNTMRYHVVQHQKVDWMRRAAEEDPGPDIFVWVDFGVFHLPGVTGPLVEEFFARVRTSRIVVPGCWDRGPVDDAWPCWRFCGTILICHRDHLPGLDAAIKQGLKARMDSTRNVPWEVNTWARVEQESTLPIEWYKADHNALLFTEYQP